MNTWSTLNLQDANSSIIERLLFFHDDAILIIIIITSIIIYIIRSLIYNETNNKFILQNQIIETTWTVIPICILTFLAVPSLQTLYLSEEYTTPSLSIKIVGHQWYWTYEYSDFPSAEFNSFITPKIYLGSFRLLDVDNRIIIPCYTFIRLLITSVDVIHSWSVPALGLKIDSIPGRINQTILFVYRPGLYFGQCSEICGINHRFIPIVIERTCPIWFQSWLKTL